MLNRNHWPQSSRGAIICARPAHSTHRSGRNHLRTYIPHFCLILVFLFFLFPLKASALATTPAASHPTLQVDAGFDSRYREGNWIPVRISLHNTGPDFTGTLSIDTSAAQSSGPGNVTSTYQVPVTLANGAQKQVTLYVPLVIGTQGITVNLLDSNGNAVLSQNSAVNAINANDIFVGILSDQSTGFGPLAGVSIPGRNGSIITEPLTASTLPGRAEVLKNFHLIILDNFTTSTLNHEQLDALQTWVNQGGALIVVGGPEWQRTLSGLPAGLLPVAIQGTSTLPPGTHLLPVGGPAAQGANQKPVSDTVQAPITISTATLVDGNAAQGTAKHVGTPLAGALTSEIVLASGTTPLIVQAQHGLGNISYLAFDPTLEPIVGWTGASALWKGLLLRTQGDAVLTPIFGPARFILKRVPGSSINGLLQSLLPNTVPSPWLLTVLLLGYLVVLGPARFLLLRWRKQRSWNWRIVLSSIIVFSLLTYGLALHEKGTSILSNRVSILQLNSDGSSAHLTTYVGIFAPSQGNYQVHLPGQGLVQPSPDDSFQGGPSAGLTNSKLATTITSGADGTDVNLLNVNIWTLRSILTEQDQQMHGGIVSNLSLQNSTLSGTVMNTLNYALNDVYVLLPNSYASLGRLAAGEMRTVHFALNNALTNPGMNLAGQIARTNGLNPYYDGSPPHNELQRHVEILGALSGNSFYGGGYCGVGRFCSLMPSSPAGVVRSITIVKSSSGFVFSGPSVSFSGGGFASTAPGSDPLLLGGAQPTLLGWADTSTDTNGLTINGVTPSGVQETLVQAPLNISSSSLPTSLSGQVVDIEGSNVQSQFSGVYTLTTGSMTFEFALPGGTNQHISNLTISEPANLTSMASPSGTGAVTDASQHALLYNWHTGSWDAITLNQQSFTTQDTSSYISPGGRILVQFSNNDSSVGTVVFGKPALNLEVDGSNP